MVISAAFFNAISFFLHFLISLINDHPHCSDPVFIYKCTFSLSKPFSNGDRTLHKIVAYNYESWQMRTKSATILYVSLSLKLLSDMHWTLDIFWSPNVMWVGMLMTLLICDWDKTEKNKLSDTSALKIAAWEENKIRQLLVIRADVSVNVLKTTTCFLLQVFIRHVCPALCMLHQGAPPPPLDVSGHCPVGVNVSDSDNLLLCSPCVKRHMWLFAVTVWRSFSPGHLRRTDVLRLLKSNYMPGKLLL